MNYFLMNFFLLLNSFNSLEAFLELINAINPSIEKNPTTKISASPILTIIPS